MIDFKPITLNEKEIYSKHMAECGERGCEFSFANLYLWGRQKYAVLHGHVVLFSQFNRRTVYPYPVGGEDKKAVLDAIISDAAERGIPCRITGLSRSAKETPDRDSFDYVYGIDDLAELKGKKYHRKRNHFNRFCDNNPDYTVEEFSDSNIERVREMVGNWYAERLAADPDADFQMERSALEKALRDYGSLGMEGLVLVCGGKIAAVTLGSRMSDNTFDVHFEKARADVDGAYAAINCEFARHIRAKYQSVKFLNREEDMGIEGLRKAKESYYPHHMVEKCWACLLEEGYEY